jgi:hypothetical protein
MILGRNGDLPIEGLMRDIKKFTAVKILEEIKASPTESRKDFLLWHFGRLEEQIQIIHTFKSGSSIVIQSS